MVYVLLLLIITAEGIIHVGGDIALFKRDLQVQANRLGALRT